MVDVQLEQHPQEGCDLLGHARIPLQRHRAWAGCESASGANAGLVAPCGGTPSRGSRAPQPIPRPARGRTGGGHGGSKCLIKSSMCRAPSRALNAGLAHC